MNSTEIVLSVIPGENSHQRILIVSRIAADQPSTVLPLEKTAKPAAVIELKQQTWGDGVGWFTQHTITVQEGQLATLRATLGVASAITHQTAAGNNRPAPTADAGWTPRVVRADSA